MEIVDFNVDALHKHQMWYVLTKNYRDELSLGRPTPSGISPYDKTSAYRMFNGRVLLGFDDIIDAQSQNGLVATNADTVEYISTQPYERIKHLCEIAPPNDQFGTFTFVDSQPVVSPDKNWRCDNGRYGPSPYPDFNNNYTDPINEKSVLLEYEPILSVPGIAHLIYLRRSNFETERNEFLNNATTQMATATLPEMFVLLNEWSKVSQAPFENSEEIAQDAYQFLNLLNFNENLIIGYPEMQIAKFIMGDINARLRPDTPLPISEQLENFIRNRSSHISLASLLSTNPGVWDIWDIAELEQTSIRNNLLAIYKKFLVSDAPEGFSLSMYREGIKEKLPEGYSGYLESWFSAYDKAEGFRQQFLK